MKNTIIDFIRVPTNEFGNYDYEIEDLRNFFQSYREMFPEREVFLMPAEMTIWQDLDLMSLKSVRDYLNTIIEQKEKEQNDL